MEDLHPGIQALLRGLLSSPLSDLGRIALDHLRCGPVADKHEAAAEDSGEYRDIPVWRWEPRRMTRAFNWSWLKQLSVAGWPTSCRWPAKFHS